MVGCVSCGGVLKYDIVSELLICESCAKRYSPEDAEIAGAEESKDFDATIYACPSCGNEILSVGNLVVSDCSYCGAQVALKSRMTKIVKPKSIIPFRITKDKCIDTFKQKLTKAPCVPDAFKDAGTLDGFRAIYVPHWVYKGEQKGDISYIVHEPKKKNSTSYYYNIKGEVNLEYEGMGHDASSTFPDAMSEIIAPYDMSDIRPFSAGYYAGFFADASDVGSSVYEFEAEKAMVDSTREYIAEMTKTQGMIGNYDHNVWRDVFHSELKDSYLAMFPVWFMTYRTKDRVSYITMNGQTGRMAFDIPVSKAKFLMTSFIFGLLLAFFLFLFKMHAPMLCTFLMSLIGIWVTLRHRKSIELITRKQGVTADYGESYAKVERAKEKNRKAYEAAKRAGMEDLYEDVYVSTEVNYKSREDYIRRKESIEKRRVARNATIYAVGFGLLYAFFNTFSTLIFVLRDKALRLAFIPVVLFGLWLGIENVIRLTETSETGKIMKGWLAVIAVILCGVTLIYSPENLMWYSVVNVISLILLTITSLDIIDKHNILGTRKSPHFDYSKFD